ncbi:MAG: SH3 domain-containing protein [Anaerolineae bacterium]|nr:SH3 domain-containing protein [Anaerolineae bacterium]
MTRRPYFFVLLTIVVLSVAALACNLSGTPADPAEEAQPQGANAPVVDIRVPINGMSFAEGSNVIVQVVGTDSGSGVSRIELLIDDVVVSSSEAPTASGQSAYMVNFEWPAQGVGAHSISAVAMRQDGTASTPEMISINVVQAQPTEVPTPLPTATPEVQPTEEPEEEPTEEPEERPTATPSGPQAETSAGVNVRSGPGTGYDVIGSLLAGTDLEVTGRNADNSWFRVPYYNAEGWVFGGLLNVSGDVNTLPVINVPPPPPTATPIPTAVPVTAAPSTPTYRFWSTNPSGSVAAGTPIRFYWEASGIKEIYFNGEPVTGSNLGGVERVVNSTTTFTLRVVYPDDSVKEESITVTVN